MSSVADVQHLLALVLKLVGGSRQNPKTRKTYKNFILDVYLFVSFASFKVVLTPSDEF